MLDLPSFTLITLVFMLFGLIEVEAAAIRFARLAPSGALVVDAIRDIARKVQVCMAGRSGMSLLTGFGSCGFVRATGFELALAWGVIAFARNSVRFIGSLLATLFPTLFAVLMGELLRGVAGAFLGPPIPIGLLTF